MNKYSYKKSYSGSWLLGIIIALGAGLFILNKTIPPKTNREVALSCTTDMATQFHIHPHLQIFINSKEQEIPADIGISVTCMHPLHTHDSSGIIHIESPQKRDFTLSDFFAVWNRPFNKDQIFDYKIDSGHIIKMTVNGKENPEFENYQMKDGDMIEIRYEQQD